MDFVLGGLVILSLLSQGHSALKPGDSPSVVVTVPAPAVRLGAFTFVQARRTPDRTPPQLERGPCNMPVIRANSDIDPKMIVPIEQGKNQAKIRAVEPTICWEKGDEPKR